MSSDVKTEARQHLRDRWWGTAEPHIERLLDLVDELEAKIAEQARALAEMSDYIDKGAWGDE